MPVHPLRPCTSPGCPELVASGRCDDHELDRTRRYIRSRSERDPFYRSVRWRRFRHAYLIEHPLCMECQATGRIEAATEVDHIVSRRRGGADFDESNLRALCAACHARKTARTDIRRDSRGEWIRSDNQR